MSWLSITVISTLVLSSYVNAGLLPDGMFDEDSLTYDEYDANLIGISDCPDNPCNGKCPMRWTNPQYKRVNASTVLINLTIENDVLIPDHSYMVEIGISNQPNDDMNQRVLLASALITDACKELDNEENKAVQKVKTLITGGDYSCPIKPGTYRAQNIDFDASKFRPFMREKIMAFTIKQRITTRVISCTVIEFGVENY